MHSAACRSANDHSRSRSRCRRHRTMSGRRRTIPPVCPIIVSLLVSLVFFMISYYHGERLILRRNADMILENTGLDGMKSELAVLDDIADKLGFVRWQWEYSRA